MTRYTKLEGRRALPTANRTVFDDDEESKATTAPVSAAPEPEAPPAYVEPKQLMKRAKLLRLKAKKANSDETRAKHLQNAKALEQQASVMNGRRGAVGKRKSRDDATGRQTRPRLETDQSKAFRIQMRNDERNAGMRCFVCRGTGHSAKDCPENVGATSSVLGEVDTSKLGKDTVGICFRCGSTEHTLAKCRRPAPKVGDELPFATCYICTKQNKGHGVYPNGGDCKVCHSVEHLAKDCPMDPQRTSAAYKVEAGGVGMLATEELSVGADDDEFHHFAQHNAKKSRSAKAPAKPSKKVVSF